MPFTKSELCWQRCAVAYHCYQTLSHHWWCNDSHKKRKPTILIMGPLPWICCNTGRSHPQDRVYRYHYYMYTDTACEKACVFLSASIVHMTRQWHDHSKHGTLFHFIVLNHAFIMATSAMASILLHVVLPWMQYSKSCIHYKSWRWMSQMITKSQYKGEFCFTTHV